MQTQPMAPNSGELTVIAMLDRAFRIYRANFLGLFLLCLAIMVPIELATAQMGTPLNDFLQRNLNNPAVFSSPRAMSQLMSIVGSSTLISTLASLVQFSIIYGLITIVVSEFLFGNRISPLSALSHNGGRLVMLFFAALLVGVILIVLAVLLSFVYYLCGFGLAALFYYGIAQFTMLPSVLTLERSSITKGIARAQMLIRHRFGYAFRLWFLYWLISIVLGLIVNTVLTILFPALFDTRAGVLRVSQLQLIQVISIVFQAFLTPIFPIAMTLYYYDTRTRIEGLDMQLAASDVSNVRPSDLVTPEPEPLLMRIDLNNIGRLMIPFVILVVALLAISGLLVNVLSSGMR